MVAWTNLQFPVARGNEPTISSPHYVKGHGLLIRFKLLASWCIKRECFWHCLHFGTYSVASFCICGHQNSWVIAQWANEHPPIWLPQTPSWSLVRSSSTLLGCKQRKYGPPKDLRYKMQSVDNQYWEVMRRTLSASFVSTGTWSSTKKLTIGSIQHGLAIATARTLILTSMLGSFTTSTLTNRGTSLFSDDSNVASELACRFCPWAI